MIKIKNIPNYITIFRILGAIGLIFVRPFSLLFLVIYILCGMSDTLDGYLARKMEACSKLGQILDGISDFIFICVILSKVFLIIIIPLWAMYWALFIAIVRLTSFIICFIRYHQFAFLHTYANKITGIILFFFPLWYLAFGVEATAVFLCSIASISAIEELLINLTSKELERDIKFIFSK